MPTAHSFGVRKNGIQNFTSASSWYKSWQVASPPEFPFHPVEESDAAWEGTQPRACPVMTTTWMETEEMRESDTRAEHLSQFLP